jgi:hypothetical protein
MDLLIILIEYDSCIIMIKTKSFAKRIFGVISCLLVYVGTVALDLYNAARYKEEAYLNGGHLYTNWYSVYAIPEFHCIDGLDIFFSCVWPMLLILPLLLYFTVKRETLSKWYKILIIMSTILLVDSIVYDLWLLSQTLVPEFDWGGGPPLYMLYTMVKFGLKVVYVIMLLVWPFLHMFKAKPVIMKNHL